MAARRIRSIVARSVVVTGLAASLFAGASALGAPRDASAMDANIGCVAKVAGYHYLGNYYEEVGNYDLARYYYRLAYDAADCYAP